MNNRLIPALALVVSIGIFFFYVRPAWTEDIGAMKVALANDDSALAAWETYKNQQNELASARNMIDLEDLARLEIFLPDSVDNVHLILDLNALAARSGLSLSDINVASNGGNAGEQATLPDGTPAYDANPVNSADLTLSAVGTYTALQTFLSGIERSQRLLDVRDITVRGSETGVYTYNMIVRLYWLR